MGRAVRVSEAAAEEGGPRPWLGTTGGGGEGRGLLYGLTWNPSEQGAAQ